MKTPWLAAAALALLPAALPSAALPPAISLPAARGAEVALTDAWRPIRVAQRQAVPFQAASQPHPAVVRVIAPERGGTSLGSGTLVAVGRDYGIVVTNWHVVRDAEGPLVVVFSDGFRSPGRVLKTDRAWDLAAVAIERPDVPPVALSTAAPRPGEALTIAGYGAGSYRAATGRCTQYLSPGRRLPFEMVEVSTAARQGDSGGPIFNRRGELAGVLFGAGQGTTSGSYCLRVAEFLWPLMGDAESTGEPLMVAARSARIDRLPRVPKAHPAADAIAAAASLADYPATFAPQAGALPGAPDDGTLERAPFDDGPRIAGWRPWRVPPDASSATADPAASPDDDRYDDYDTYDSYAYDTYARGTTDDEPTTDDTSDAAARPADRLAAEMLADAGDAYVPLPQESIPANAAAAETASITASLTPRAATETIVLDAAASEPLAEADREELTWQDVAGASLWDQVKTVLAVLGAVAVALHGLRWMKMV